MEYAKWLQAVDAILTDIYGLGHRDMPDFNWMDMFEDGLPPSEAVECFTDEEMDEGEDQSPGDVLGLYDERQEY